MRTLRWYRAWLHWRRRMLIERLQAVEHALRRTNRRLAGL